MRLVKTYWTVVLEATVLCLCGCSKPALVTEGRSISRPREFPRGLMSFGNPRIAFGVDGKAWDASGLGPPSNAIFVNGTFWVCTQGYATKDSYPQAIGCWSGPSLDKLQPYKNNPVLVNKRQGWTSACIVKPSLNAEGARVYLSFIGFKAGCDSDHEGSVGISSSTALGFPDHLSDISDTPQISGDKMGSILSSSVIDVNGICVDYVTMRLRPKTYLGRLLFPPFPMIASFRTSGPCVGTELSTMQWSFFRGELTTGQIWDGGTEVEDPQVFKLEGGQYAMIFSGRGTFQFGYAYTTNPLTGVWQKLQENPIKHDGTLVGPRIVKIGPKQYEGLALLPIPDQMMVLDTKE